MKYRQLRKMLILYLGKTSTHSPRVSRSVLPRQNLYNHIRTRIGFPTYKSIIGSSKKNTVIDCII